MCCLIVLVYWSIFLCLPGSDPACHIVRHRPFQTSIVLIMPPVHSSCKFTQWRAPGIEGGGGIEDISKIMFLIPQ